MDVRRLLRSGAPSYALLRPQLWSKLWSIEPSSQRWVVSVRSNSGAEGRDRTADTGFFRPVLYQLSYLGRGRYEISRCYQRAPATATEC